MCVAGGVCGGCKGVGWGACGGMGAAVCWGVKEWGGVEYGR